MNRALLIGGPVDGEWIDLENPADHQVITIEVDYKKDTDDEGEKKRFQYQINPITGQEQTWHIGRADGVGFDEAISHVLLCYHLTANRRKPDDKFASHERDSRRDAGAPAAELTFPDAEFEPEV